MNHNNLNKWQASSHPELASRSADELFPAEQAKQYKFLHNHIFKRVVHLHGTISTLEELEEFPFSYVYGLADHMQFWRLVVDNFWDMAIVQLHALVNDSSNDAHTIQSFKNDIIKWPWHDTEMRNLFQHTLKERRFDPDIEMLADQIKDIRHNRVAHSLIDKCSGLPKPYPGTNLHEIRKLFDAVHGMFGALCFGSAFVTLCGDLIPATVGGTTTPTCLETVLNAVLSDSDFVNEPEQMGQCWPGLREVLDPEHVRVMNECRKRIDLPEA